MKRTVALLSALLILTCCLLTGCRKNQTKMQRIVRPSASQNEGETTAEKPKMLVNPGAFSERDVIEMGNYMNTGCYAEKDGWFFGYQFIGSKDGVLTKMRPDGTEQSKLSDTSPNYIAFMDDWVYYLAADFASEGFSVRRVRTSGEGEEQILVDAPGGNERLDYMFLGDGHVYYAVNDEESADEITGRLMRCDPDGGNPTVILDKPVYYPYFVGDSILFQDDHDGSTLHRCDPDGKNDRQITDCVTYQYICDGKYIYYNALVKMDGSNGEIDSEDEQKNMIRRCDLNGNNREDVITDCDTGCFNLYKDTLCYTNMDDDYRRYVYHLSDGTTELLTNETYITQCWYMDDQLVYVKKDPDLYHINRLVRIAPDGSDPLTIYE